jgi:ABC-type nitrate/sulfonate/bicarbonate transport system substrate-binding protein
MMQNRRNSWRWSIAAAAVVFAVATGSTNAEPRTVRIAQQFGISYLPLTIMQDKHLLEQEGKKLGLDLQTEWTHFSNGAAMNNALLSGNLDIASGGVGPLVTAWARTKGKQDIKGLCALNSMPLYLNTIDPKVKTIKDFTDKDKIALPAVRVSMQAVILQMAALKMLGKGHEHDLDKFTVSLSHPDGLAQMMSFKSEITGHFTSAPFMYQELANPKVHRVLNSYDVFGGPHTFNVVWAMGNFYKDNPKIVEAFLSALDIAMKEIKNDPKGSAALWVRVNHSKLPVEEAERIIELPENTFTTTPQKVMVVANYMADAKMVPNRPARWQDMFIDAIHKLPGS